MNGVTLDAGALIALDRGDRRILVLLARAREVGAIVTVPATALAQAIRQPGVGSRGRFCPPTPAPPCFGS